MRRSILTSCDTHTHTETHTHCHTHTVSHTNTLTQSIWAQEGRHKAGRTMRRTQRSPRRAEQRKFVIHTSEYVSADWEVGQGSKVRRL
jgi:hypothetical protein